jgi:hypothetical protein
MPTTGYTSGSSRVSVYDPAINPTHVTGLWQTCPLWEYHHDPSIGVLYDEGFLSYDATNDWTLTQATAGSAAIDTTNPGTLKIDAGATTQHQGANLQRLKACFVPAANKSLWFETLVQLSATTPPVTKWQGFIGLAASDTTILPSGAHSTNNRIGFHTLTTENLLLTFTADKAGASTTKTGTTLVAATDIRLGFFYDGVADTLQQYINGVATGTAVATANIPKLIVYPSVVVQSDAVDRPTMLLRSMKVFQLR